MRRSGSPLLTAKPAMMIMPSQKARKMIQKRQSVHLRSLRALKMMTSLSATLLLQQQHAPIVADGAPGPAAGCGGAPYSV